VFSVRGAQGVIHHFRVNQILAPPQTLLSSDQPTNHVKKKEEKIAPKMGCTLLRCCNTIEGQHCTSFAVAVRIRWMDGCGDPP